MTVQDRTRLTGRLVFFLEPFRTPRSGVPESVLRF